MGRRLLWVVVGFCLMARLGAAQIQPVTQESPWTEGGYGMLALLCNVLYMPAKLVYSSLGLVTGGVASVLTVGDTDTALCVW